LLFLLVGQKNCFRCTTAKINNTFWCIIFTVVMHLLHCVKNWFIVPHRRNFTPWVWTKWCNIFIVLGLRFKIELIYCSPPSYFKPLVWAEWSWFPHTQQSLGLISNSYDHRVPTSPPLPPCERRQVKIIWTRKLTHPTHINRRAV
jgi:hypothetical protein